VQRLFSNFADGWPGTALLLLRLGTGAMLIEFGIGSPSAVSLVATAGGALLLAGLWTPIVGTAIAITELWITFSQSNHLRSHFLLAILGACLAMIGPGAWSIDARLFGRKQIDPSNFERESDRARKW
jgi:uncharacterized membrane protein YphA (DoxX/SURF4 family)